MLGVESAVVVDGKENANLSKSARNLPKSKYLAPEGLNVYDILNHPGLVIAADAVKLIEARVTVAAKAQGVKDESCVHPKRSSSARCSPRRGPCLKETGGQVEAKRSSSAPAHREGDAAQRDRRPADGEVDPETLKSQLLFEVARDANKIEIRHAVEKLWNVDVLSVRTAVVRGKEKRMGRYIGRRSNWKKAVVTIAPGQNIEFFEGV